MAPSRSGTGSRSRRTQRTESTHPTGGCAWPLLILVQWTSTRGAMTKPLSRRRRIYLRRELHVIRGAVEAARILGEAVATDQLGPERDHRRAPRAITSLLTLVDE